MQRCLLAKARHLFALGWARVGTGCAGVPLPLLRTAGVRQSGSLCGAGAAAEMPARVGGGPLTHHPCSLGAPCPSPSKGPARDQRWHLAVRPLWTIASFLCKVSSLDNKTSLPHPSVPCREVKDVSTHSKPGWSHHRLSLSERPSPSPRDWSQV